MTDPTPLSPAAQAVLKVACIHHGLFNEEIIQRRRMVAAALRAAADRAIREPEHYEGLDHSDYDDGWNEALGYITSIAAELEGGK